MKKGNTQKKIEQHKESNKQTNKNTLIVEYFLRLGEQNAPKEMNNNMVNNRFLKNSSNFVLFA